MTDTTNRESSVELAIMNHAGARRSKITVLGSLVATILVTFIPTVSYPTQASGNESMIEEVLVSARKRDEPVHSAPVAMTVLSNFDLTDQSVRKLADVAFHAPNVQIKPYPAVNADANVSMRGQSQFEPIITMDPPAALYLDDVYLGRSTASLMNLVDIDRVEVLMGPQGTLYGRNTTGGLVHLITKRYEGERLSGYFDVVGGDLGRRDLSGAVSLPFVDGRIGARLSFRKARYDGQNKNVYLDESLDDEDVEMVRVNLSAQLNSDWNLRLSYDKTRQREHSALFRLDYIKPAVLRPACIKETKPELGCLINTMITGSEWRSVLERGNRKIRSDVSSRHNVDVWGGAATLEGSIGKLGIKSITAYRTLSRRNINDIDGTRWTILHPDADASQRQVSNELQLFGVVPDSSLEWTVGTFYFDETGEDKTTVVGIPELNPLSPSIIIPKGKNLSVAGYVHFIYGLTSKTNFNAGSRVTYERRHLSTSQENARGCTLEFINRPPCETKVSKAFSGWSYTASVDHQSSDNSVYYMSFSRGFKSGGFNARASEKVEFEPFGPEIVESLDIGYKSTWLDQRVRLNLSAFYSEYRNIQRTQLVAISRSEIATRVANAARAKIVGGELQFSAQPKPRWSFRTTAGTTIAKYEDFAGMDEYGNLVDKSHLELPNTPRFSFSVLLRNVNPITIGATNAEFALQADYSWQDRVYNDIDNGDIDQPAYGLLNLRASLYFKAKDIEVALFARNVTDEIYVTGGLDLTEQFGYRGTFLGPGRSTNLQITWKF